MALTTCMTVMPVWLLGAVSTACDDVTEDLNELRLQRFTNEVDERVGMLERAFRGINHGQGIGFKVMGLVLTKKVLGIIFFEFLCGLLFVVPIIWSNTAMGGVEDHSGSIDSTSCALSHPQKTFTVDLGVPYDAQAAIAAALSVLNSSCVVNVTIGRG